MPMQEWTASPPIFSQEQGETTNGHANIHNAECTRIDLWILVWLLTGLITETWPMNTL